MVQLESLSTQYAYPLHFSPHQLSTLRMSGTFRVTKEVSEAVYAATKTNETKENPTMIHFHACERGFSNQFTCTTAVNPM